MTTTTPIQESANEHLCNALQLTELWINTNWGRVSRNQMEPVLQGIAQRIRHAQTQLSEPAPSMIVALRSIVESHSSLMTQHESPEEMDRYWRDSAAIVLRAAVTGFTPGLGASVAVSSSGPSAERTGVQVAPSSGVVVERCSVCGGIVHEVHPKHDVWVHDKCWGEYIATRAEFYGDED